MIPAIPPPPIGEDVETFRSIIGGWAPVAAVVAVSAAGGRWTWKMVRGFVTREEFEALRIQVDLLAETRAANDERLHAHAERLKRLERSIDATSRELKEKMDTQTEIVLEAIGRLSLSK